MVLARPGSPLRGVRDDKRLLTSTRELSGAHPQCEAIVGHHADKAEEKKDADGYEGCEQCHQRLPDFATGRCHRAGAFLRYWSSQRTISHCVWPTDSRAR